MKTLTTTYHNRATTPDEQYLYDHWLNCVSLESPEDLIARFYALFFEGMNYGDREVVRALDNILKLDDVDDYFRFILNRCCHILINRWQSQPRLQAAIPALIELFEQTPEFKRVGELSRGRTLRRLHQVMHDFLQTEQYHSLRRLARIIEARQEAKYDPQAATTTETVPLGQLIDRYPYLYEHCLLTEDSDLEHQRHIRRIQSEVQKQVEINLSQYVTYRVRCSRLQREGRLQTLNHLRVIQNPTLLTDQELVTSIKQFGDHKVGTTYGDLANRFMQENGGGLSYANFKAHLYDYLTAGVDPAYGQRQFNKLLTEQLHHIYPESDGRSVNDFLIVRTCSQLFNFLVVDNRSDAHHFLFVDLINNLGPTLTTGLLLRILLICRKVKPYLERRFSVLFNHYEASRRDQVSWLVKMLENLNIALSLNFGSLDLSHIF